MCANSIIKRELRISLPDNQSAFLWGPRKTGKSTLLKTLFPESIKYDLLNTDLFMRLSREPFRLREELLARTAAELSRPVILDEVQKVPALLDEVHWLIENKGLRFILCGSSARKLKKGHANLLGGRAWRYEMFPLCWKEMPDLDLVKVLNSGLIPSHFFSTDPKRSLKAYTQDYLKEEILSEGLVRNLPPFIRFLDSMAFGNGEITNYANIARDCGIDSKTVKAYYDILVDTLIGRFVPPYSRRTGRQSILSAEKFYLFDVGLAGNLTHRHIEQDKGPVFGQAFEHFILMEMWAHREYTSKDYAVRYWRTKQGVEVDFILGDCEVAVEVKGTARLDSTDMKAIRVFANEYRPKRSIVVCNESTPRRVDNIDVLPWRVFLEKLWSGEII